MRASLAGVTMRGAGALLAEMRGEVKADAVKVAAVKAGAVRAVVVISVAEAMTNAVEVDSAKGRGATRDEPVVPSDRWMDRSHRRSDVLRKE